MKKTFLILAIFAAVLAALLGVNALKERFFPEEAVEASSVEKASDRVEWENELDLEKATEIRLNGDSVSVHGGGAAVIGGAVTICYPGTYRLSGTLTDGQIVVSCDHDGTVYLVLDSISVRCSDGPAVFVTQSNETVLYLPEGSESTLADGASYALVLGAGEVAEPDQPDAAVYSRDDLRIEGEGALTVTGSYHDAIHGKDDIRLCGGSLTLSAVNDGVKGTEGVSVEGGAIAIFAGADGIQSTKADVTLSGGAVSIVSGGDGVAAETNAEISGGSLSVVSAGGSAHYEDIYLSEISAKGVKTVGALRVSGGTLSFDTADDALHADGNLSVGGGEITVSSGDDGLAAGGMLSVSGGSVRVLASYEGLDASVIDITGGEILLVADNNGVAATADTYAGISPSDCRITVSGGLLEVTASRALKTDGDFILKGGAALLNASSDSREAIVVGGDCRLDGGMAVVCGTLTDAAVLDGSGRLCALLFRAEETAAAGTLLSLKNEAGEDFFNYTLPVDCDDVLVSCRGLSVGDVCTVAAGEESRDVTLDAAVTVSEPVVAAAAASGEFGGFGGRRGF